MKHKICAPIFFILAVSLFSVGCSSNPNRGEVIQTNLDGKALVSQGQSVGIKNGEMVVLDKGQISEKLRDLQNNVYLLEDKVYGTRKLGTLGQYGELKSCLRKLASKQYGGDGNLSWTEPLDRVTDKEDDLKIGLDEKNDLIGVSVEYLRDRVQRFQNYRAILQKRSDDFSERTEACRGQLSLKTVDAAESSKVLVNEVPKSSLEKLQINEFMCGFVHSGASLESFMINAFARGWLSLSDFQMTQNLVAGTLKDSKGETLSNGFLFNGWKLVFDNSPVTVGDLLAGLKSAKLVGWSYEHKSAIGAASSCLSASDGVWNH